MKLLKSSRYKPVKELYSEKVKEALESYEGRNLNHIDKKILRGLNEKIIQDAEDTKDKILSIVKKFILMRVQKEREKILQENKVTNPARFFVNKFLEKRLSSATIVKRGET